MNKKCDRCGELHDNKSDLCKRCEYYTELEYNQFVASQITNLMKTTFQIFK